MSGVSAAVEAGVGSSAGSVGPVYSDRDAIALAAGLVTTLLCCCGCCFFVYGQRRAKRLREMAAMAESQKKQLKIRRAARRDVVILPDAQLSKAPSSLLDDEGEINPETAEWLNQRMQTGGVTAVVHRC